MKEHRYPPLISIIIPTYNYAEYLADSINSALAQTYSTIEILVVDDGSTDNTSNVLKRYADLVQYYVVPHSGVSAARNFGAKKAKGKYIVFLDADNKLYTDYLEKTLMLLQKQDSHVGYVYTQLQYFEASDYVTQYPGYKLGYLKVSNFIDVCSLVKTSLVKKFPYDHRLSIWEDWDFYLTLAEHSISGILLNEPLVYYRRQKNKGSALDNMTDRKKETSMHLLRRKHWRLYGPAQTGLYWIGDILLRLKPRAASSSPVKRDH